MNPNPDMYALVDELKEQGMVVGMLSNIPARYATMIRRTGLYEPFCQLLLSYEICVKKPNPLAYKIMISRVGVPPSEIVFIDDKQQNVDGAKCLGIDAILFESPEQVREALVERNALH